MNFRPLWVATTVTLAAAPGLAAHAQAPDAVLMLTIRNTPREGLDPLINDLVYSSPPRATMVVASLLSDFDASTRAKAAYILGFLPRRTALEPDLRRAAGDADWEVRKFAAYALARHGTPQAVPELQPLLSDERREVRMEAARALGTLGGPKAGAALRKALASVGEDREWEVAVVGALGSAGDRKSIPMLEARTSHPSEAVQLAALRGLALMGVESARLKLLGRVTHTEPYVRRDAARLLGEVKRPWATEALLARLEDSDAKVRLSAAESLGRHDDERGLVFLIRAAEGPDPRAALAAADALTRLRITDERRKVLRRKAVGPLEAVGGDDGSGGPPAPPAADPTGLRDRLSSEGASFEERLLAVSEHLKGVPYLDSPLGEGAGYDPDPLVRWDAVDCLTYVEQVLAVANASSASSDLPVLIDLRYHNGRIGYGTRNHLMMAQWIPSNVAKGYLEDITRAIGGEAVIEVEKVLSPELWSQRRGVELPLSAEEVPLSTVKLPVIPKEAFAELMPRIPDGTLLLVVRKDIPARPYRVTHLGFVVQRDGKTYLRHAARAGYQKVVDELLDTFVRRNSNYRKWPVAGFNLLLPLENSSRVRELTTGTSG